MGWTPGQNMKNGTPTLRWTKSNPVSEGTQVPVYQKNNAFNKYGLLGYSSPQELVGRGRGAAAFAQGLTEDVKNSNDDLLTRMGITDDKARQDALNAVQGQMYTGHGLSQINPTWTGQFDDQNRPTYEAPMFVQSAEKNKNGNFKYSSATGAEGENAMAIAPDLGYGDWQSTGNYTLGADGSRSTNNPNVWSDARMHGAKYRGMSFEDAVKASGLLEQMGYDIDWDDMQSYAKALNDFQINGSQDDWYNWVNELSPYYAGYEDLSWDSDANLFNREAFNDWWDANELTYLDQLLAESDTEGLRRLFGDSEITSQELGDYVFSDYSSPDGQRYTIWDDQRGDQALANILSDIYDLEGDINYDDIFNSGEYGVGTNYDAMMSELGREFGRQMAVNPEFVGLTEKQMQPYIKRYK